jgi:type II secretory pathway pseudopilin PulG
VVIVVAIVAILAAIAIPRMSRGSKGAGNAALRGDLRVLRGAIDHYSLDHGGSYPTLASIGKQLTEYTDYAGSPRTAPDATHIYGPYLRNVPPLPVGIRQGATGISDSDAEDVGWIYNETTGIIKANCGPAERDDALRAFRDY